MKIELNTLDKITLICALECMADTPSWFYPKDANINELIKKLVDLK